MPNLKVLPNEYQVMMEQRARIAKVFKREVPEFDVLTHYKRITPVYNRVGHYKLGKREWLEFIMPDGTFRAVTGLEDFNRKLERYVAKEKAMDLESFNAMKRLVEKGFIPETSQLRNETWRRQERAMLLDAKKWGKEVRAKIAARKAEKENV